MLRQGKEDKALQLLRYIAWLSIIFMREPHGFLIILLNPPRHDTCVLSPLTPAVHHHLVLIVDLNGQ